MKRIITILLSAISIGAYAQRVAMPTTPVTDSVRAKINKNDKTQEVDGTVMRADKDIVQNITNAPKFSIVYSAIRSAGLVGTFKSKGPITFFAPTNDAFKKLSKGKMDTLLKKPHIYELCNLLTCHAIAGRVSLKVLAKQIKSGNGTATLTTISGCKLFATMDGENFVLTDETGNKSMIEPEDNDIEQSNGLIHVINNVLVPKAKSI